LATTNLFGDPIFKDGAFISNDAKVRAYALQKACGAFVHFSILHMNDSGQ